MTTLDVLFQIADDDRYRAAIDQAARVLRPGGHLFVIHLFPHGTAFRGYHQASRHSARTREHPVIDVPGWLAPIATRW